MIDPLRVLAIARSLAGCDGLYVEAGANDGIRQSNTLLIQQELGWRGLLVEPSPSAFAELCLNRPDDHLINAALVAPEMAGIPIKGTFKDGHLTGTIVSSLFDRSPDLPKGKIQSGLVRFRKAFYLPPKSTPLNVPTTTLDLALQEVGIDRVDLLSLDVEGFELQALKGLDFKQIRPSVIILEVRKGEAWDLIQLLTSRGYALVENLSGFGVSNSPTWTGDHEDFLFVNRSALLTNESLRSVIL